MRKQSIVLAALLVTFTWGCAGQAVNQPAPLSPASQAMQPAASSALTQAPHKALLQAPGKALATPEKALANPEKALLQTPALPSAIKVDVSESLQAFVTLDDELDNTELMSRMDQGFSTQGWFSDMKDKVKTKWETYKVNKETKKQLKDKDEFQVAQKRSFLDKLKRDRQNLVSTTEVLEGGGKQITTTWQDKNLGGNASTKAVQVYDAEGTLISTTITQTGTNGGGKSFELIRSRTLKGDDGTYEVYTKRTETFKDGKVKISEWTKLVTPDGHETITATITNPNGKVITVAGTKSKEGKTKIDKATEATAS